jgi:hypothetical protein
LFPAYVASIDARVNAVSHTIFTMSISSITQFLKNHFYDPTVDQNDDDDIDDDDDVDKGVMVVTRDTFLNLDGFTDTPTEHSLRSKLELREIPDKKSILDSYDGLSVS